MIRWFILNYYLFLLVLPIEDKLSIFSTHQRLITHNLDDGCDNLVETPSPKRISSYYYQVDVHFESSNIMDVTAVATQPEKVVDLVLWVSYTILHVFVSSYSME